ncbi:MAG TPA: AAA family ATPase [Candidatus Micrarchaeia archaeon]|nr:AAA family ATPase [Candidatus Micrarchaeia archaeon]
MTAGAPLEGAAGCSLCGAANPTGHRFCGQCGAPLRHACPACGQLADPAQRFCGACGAALVEPAAHPAPVAARPAADSDGGGRRVASVLFADLVGFTALAQAQEPEVVREFLSGYFDVARTVVVRAGGVVEKFIGDAVMAVWGTAGAMEDDAERAVRAGLELVDQVAAYGEARQRPGLATRVGVVTGAVATWVRPGEGLVAGDRVNLASRVQSVAGPGTVYVDAATREASSAGIEYVAAGAHALKGLPEPVALWQAVRVLARIGGGGRGGEWEAPFVGRRRELTWLKDLYHDVADRGRARLLSVTGLAGVGKSRLTWELEKYLDGLQAEMFWHRGRCLAYGDGVAFWPLAEMVRGRLRLAEDLPAEDLASQLDTGLGALQLELGELAPLREALAVLLGLSGPSLERADLFARWRRFFECLAAQAPVVMVLDDLQWADTGLLDFLESCLDWSAECPLLVVTLARPQLADRRRGWGAQRRNATALTLEPLTPQEMRELLQGLVPDLPHDTASPIVAAAEGIPLYAVELVRALTEQGTLVRRGERYVVTGSLRDLPVPASLTALLAARLDALSPAARELASRLAVFAGPFPPAAAQAVAALAEDELEVALGELRRTEVLGVRGDPLAADRGQYVFAQGLMRSAAYDRLSRAERRAAHVAAAAHLQGALPDAGAEVAEAIAVHLQAAQAATPEGPEADAMRDAAAAAFARAGARAVAVGAPAAALRAYQRARDLAPGDASAEAWQVAAAEAAIAAGDYEVALAVTERRAPDPSPGGVEAVALSHLRALAHASLGQGAEALAVLEAALAARADRPADAESALLHAYLASNHFVAGRHEAAEVSAERALAEGQAFQVVEAVARGAQQRAAVLMRQGRFEEAVIHYEWSLRLAPQTGRLTAQITAVGNLADAEAQLDRPEAEGHLEEAIALARRAGNRGLLVVAVSNLLWVWSLRGRWADAVRLAGEHLHDEVLNLHPNDRAYIHVRLAVLAGWRGDPALASPHLPAVEAMASNDDVQARTMAGAALVAVALAAGRAAEALDRAEPLLAESAPAFGISHETVRQLWPDVVEAAIASGSHATAERHLSDLAARPPGVVPPYLLAQLARLSGLLARSRGGDPARIASDLAGAVERFRRLGYPYWLARAQLDEATFLVGQGDLVAAASAATAASAAFAELEAPAWAERARQLAAVEAPPVPAG